MTITTRHLVATSAEAAKLLSRKAPKGCKSHYYCHLRTPLAIIDPATGAASETQHYSQGAAASIKLPSKAAYLKLIADMVDNNGLIAKGARLEVSVTEDYAPHYSYRAFWV